MPILLGQVGKKLVKANVMKSCPHFVQNTSSAGIKAELLTSKLVSLLCSMSKGPLC